MYQVIQCSTGEVISSYNDIRTARVAAKSFNDRCGFIVRGIRIQGTNYWFI